MKLPMRTIAGMAGALLIFVVFAMAYSTAKGYTVWYVKLPISIISVNGKQAKGWLHRATNERSMYFTRADSSKPVTYSLVFVDGGNGYVWSCSTWVAPRLPAIPVGDLNPPCFLEGSAGRNLTRGPRSIAFTTGDGTRLEAHW
jgi:hypothetical protein